MRILENTKDARRAYREILQGYSHIEEHNLYIKHFNETDIGEIEILYNQCEKKLKSMGLERTKEKLKFLNENDYWTDEEERAYLTAKLGVQDAHKFKSTLRSPIQIEKFEKVLENQIDNLEKITAKRAETLYPTIESYCDRKINEDYVRCALFKDKELKDSYLTQEEFKEISYTDLGNLVKKYNHSMDIFDETNLKKIAVNGFFLNPFLMSNNDPVKFFGRSILELTMYQINLYGKGKYYKSILEEGKDPPDNLYEDVDVHGLAAIVAWFDTAHAQILSERAQKDAQHKAQAIKGRR